jgi:hypothetical protein
MLDAADMTLDGAIDGVVGTKLKKLEVWVNSGNGTMSEHPKSPHNPSEEPAFVRLRDMDGDGDADVVVGAKLELQVWRNKGPGNAAGDLVLPGSQKFTLSAEATAGDTGDVTGDGWPDVAVGLGDTSLQFWRGSSSTPILTTGPGDTFSNPSKPVVVVIALLDAGALPDVVAGLDGLQLRVWSGLSTGLAAPTTHATAAKPTALAVGPMGGP